MQSTPRLKYIDTLRGLAILLVVIGHAIGGVPAEYGGGSENLVWKIIYSFHMPLMFIVSGMVALDWRVVSADVVRERIHKNILGIYIPYLVWGYVYWGVSVLFYAGDYTGTVNDGWKLPWDNSAWPMGWFLLVLFAIKMIDVLLQVVLGWIDVSLRVYVELVLWTIAFIIFRNTEVWLWANVVKYGLFFTIGRGLREWKLTDGLEDFKLFTREKSALRELGQRSMAVYIIHPYVLVPVRIAMLHIGITSIWGILVVEAVAFSLVMNLCFRLMDRRFWVDALFYPTKYMKKDLLLTLTDD